ncbi:MAG: M67 family metallopeptidase [Candidatus Omnitrophica bacterium]|nr:M67 family metallopeptidase [Candidatus Omnitrophota bacterium]
MVRITGAALQEMIAHAQRDYPNEACGYLAARDGMLVRAIPMRNADASPTSYTMDSREQLAVQRSLRAQGLEHGAIYHSHVATEAYPSRRDIAHALAIQEFCRVPYFLVTLKEARPRVRAFTILDGHVREEELVEVAA